MARRAHVGFEWFLIPTSTLHRLSYSASFWAEPLHTCVWGVGFRFYGGTLKELWRRAVCCGVISDAESVEFCKSTPTRRCYSSEEDRDANGVALRTCLDCFNATGRTASTKRFGHKCRSLQHSQFSADKPDTARPGPACLPYLWGINEA